MSYEITEDGNSKSACYAYVVTGYLKSFTKEMKEADGTEPTKYDFMEEIQKIVDNAKEVGIKSGVGQVERGQNGTVHWQGYYQFNKKQKFRTFQNKLAKICEMTWNLQPAMGSTEQNVTYCTKGTGDFTYSTGAVKYSEQLSEPVWINEKDLVLKKGKRSDLAALTKLIEAGGGIDDIDREMPSLALRYDKHIERMIFRRDSRDARANEVNKHCYFLYGDAGTGKTQDVLKYRFPEMFGFKAEDVFILNKGNNGNLWWNGYDHHRVLLIDDIEPKMVSRQNLLRILDDISFKGESKGGVVQTCFELVFITSNYHPHEILTKTERWIEYDDYENQIQKKQEVVDPALLSRFDGMLDYSGCKNLRADRKTTQHIKMSDAKSVASLLPATLALGTEGALGQCGSERVQPSPNSPQEGMKVIKIKKPVGSKFSDNPQINLGTVSDEKELKDYA
tara:strand:- start:393 stop:1739 length:1347 start_codon:yes stop_codon:yes gene_type:complete